MKIVLVTTGQPSVNPRIVKEADVLCDAGHDVVVLYCFFIQWAFAADKKLLKNVKWKYQLVGGSPVNGKLLYYYTKARFKIFGKLNRSLGNQLLIAERSQARCYHELLEAAKSIKADWYIGHNLGALPIVVKAALHNSGASGFDFEDYHRAENTNEGKRTTERIVFLEEKYVPFLKYVSASSPHITERISVDFNLKNKRVLTLLNCFPLSLMPHSNALAIRQPELHLFWFSQTIGRNRGLEDVIYALKEINNPLIHLTLAGRCDEDMNTFINEHTKKIKACIHFAGIIQPENLPAFACKFDVGLATEQRVPLNRNICLTNKIFVYLLAGNCILASDTDAQKTFLTENAGIGLLFKSDDIVDLKNKINLLFTQRNLLNEFKERSRNLAVEQMNWENEAKKLIEEIKLEKHSTYPLFNAVSS